MRGEKLFLLAILSVVSLTSIAQKTDRDRRTINIQKKVINFLISKGELDGCNNLNTCLPKITIVDLVSKEPIDYQKNGVFLFREVNPPSTTFILLIKSRKIEIIDLKNLSYAMKEISSFLIKLNIPKEKCILYYQEIILVYNYNGYGLKYRM